MESNPRDNLQGLKVVAFESRRAKEMAELIRRYRGEPIVAPSMREVALSENHAALGKVQLVARGPKPIGALKELGLQAAVTVPEPNTWREILSTLDADVDLQGKRIAIQEYGIANPELTAALQSRGAAVTLIPIYRWALPEDLAPLHSAIDKILGGEVDIALFTNGAQVDHLFQVASYDKADGGLRLALDKIVVASVGPVCTQVLEQFGLKPDIEPVHPKMGALLAEVAASARAILSAKTKR